MKKIVLMFVAFATLQMANAQSFYKHALVISAGIGGDVYALTETYYYKGNTNLSYTFNTAIANASYPVSVEYGLTNWLGLGLATKFDNYILKKDSITNFQPSAFGVEYGAVINIHIIRGQHLGFLIGFDIGGSQFTYTTDTYNDQLYGSGTWGDIHAALQYYFGRLGIYCSASFPTMDYKQLTSNNASINQLGQNILSSWKASGGALNVGIQYRLFSAPGE